MSGAREVAERAEHYIDQLFEEVIEGDHQDNEVSLGRVLVDGKEWQVQLKITAIRNDYIDDDEEDSEDLL